MTTQAEPIEAPLASEPRGEPVRTSLLSTLGVDVRLVGMVVALAVLWIAFNFLSDGRFLTPRNLWNLSVQSSAVAVMTTGMVLIIVSRNIDLSIGSILGFTAMIVGLLQAEWIPDILGLPLNAPGTWIVVVVLGICVGALIGGLHGFVIAFIGVPSFVVTLGGLLIWRGAAFALASGRTIAPLDPTYQLLGGGPQGALGATLSWVVAGIAIVAFAIGLVLNRRRRRRYGFPVRPVWADVTIGIIGSLLVAVAVWIANAYPWPPNLAEEYAIENGIPIPPGGLIIPTGIAYPVLIAIGIAVLMTFIAKRRRFGRYVYSIGGNPEAAVLAGINTRRTIMKTFILMGALSSIAAVIITARLNASTLALGTGAELQVIAAAVIGGTSLAGGIGTIAGGVLGAVIMQSLSTGMTLIGVDNAQQDMVAGVVLIVAVGFDSWLRRRRV
ncbi:MAG TPA: sugar ABC transporter permease [Candidatus Limnocylindria bacterium]|nr:sugar ABC transporter permease [Candidatus Limnocylindria bacterium]